jgi:hypothetical protein
LVSKFEAGAGAGVAFFLDENMSDCADLFFVELILTIYLLQ